jgi:hypothetical protein
MASVGKFPQGLCSIPNWRTKTMANPLNTFTKRELFAAFALMGTVSQPENFPTKDCAERAVQAADALIAELLKRPGKETG